MFYLKGPEEFLSTVTALTYQKNRDVSSLEELKERYVAFTCKVSGENINDINVADKYSYCDARIKFLISRYKDPSQLTDIETDILKTPKSSREQAAGVIEKGCQHLRDVNEDLYEVFDFAIHTVFYHRSSCTGGGSVSSLPGVIWCSPRLEWSLNDMSEFLVHELAHNMLFIDERRFRHYVDFDDIAKPENYARSAVLMRNRPLDKVFHSLIVAHEVLAFRLENGEPDNPMVHPNTFEMLEAAFVTVDSIKDTISKAELVTDRFIYLLDEVELSLKKLETLYARKEVA